MEGPSAPLIKFQEHYNKKIRDAKGRRKNFFRRRVALSTRRQNNLRAAVRNRGKRRNAKPRRFNVYRRFFASRRRLRLPRRLAFALGVADFASALGVELGLAVAFILASLSPL